jgi:trigger factor
LKVTAERLPESRVQLDIEVDPERLEKSLDSAYRKVASRARIPGFRPGKAPRAVVERMVGREGLIREALDRLVPDVYNEALEAQDIDAIGQPELEIIELDPVRFKATVPVRPTVDLGDYRSVRVDRQPVEVTDEMVAEQILALRRRHAIQAPVDREVRWGDFIIADVKAESDGETFVEDEGAEIALREGRELFVEGLAGAFIGMKKGEEKSIDLPLPEDFPVEKLRGKTATFRLVVQEVKEEVLPEEDDELAALVNAEQFPTLLALRARIREEMTSAAEAEEKARFQNAAIEKMLEGATLEYPALLVEREIDHMVQESVGSDRQAYLATLARVGRTEEQFRESLREPAEMRVRRSLVVSQLAEDEKVEVTDEEIEAEIARMAEPMGENAERFTRIFASGEGRETVRRNLLTRKTLDRLAAIAAGEAQEQEATE